MFVEQLCENEMTFSYFEKGTQLADLSLHPIMPCNFEISLFIFGTVMNLGYLDSHIIDNASFCGCPDSQVSRVCLRSNWTAIFLFSGFNESAQQVSGFL